MSKLISANFSRLFRNKFFLICLALVFGVALFIAIEFRLSNPWCTQQFGHETYHACFKYIPILAGIVALFVSLFVGEEYSNKTIRNKLASGYSKMKIYAASWLVCAVVGVLFYVVFFLTVSLPIAPWAGLMKYNGYIIVEIVKNAVINLFAVLAVVSVSVFIAMLVKNRIVGVVITVIGMSVLFLTSELQVIMDIQPFGQMVHAIRRTTDGAKGVLLPVYAGMVSVLFSFGGAYLFGKRDLE